MAAAQEQSAGIETNPGLSPLERRRSLEKHLQQRPDEKDLKVSETCYLISTMPWGNTYADACFVWLAG